jgi:hypothetical protein
MKKKMKRFNGEEGSEIELESKTGRNENIGDDTRARARKFVEDKEEAKVAPKAAKSSTPTSKASIPAPAPKAETKPKSETKEENTARMEDLTKKQALERVEPENYIPGAGMLKGVLKNIASRGAKSAAKETAETSVKQLTNNPKRAVVEKAREARANTRMNKMRQENADAGPPGRARASGSTNDMGGTFKEYEIRPDFKKGGSVKSASSRADGCAVRGKTRA